MPRIINLANITPFQATSLTDPGYIPGPRIIPNAAQVRLNWNLGDVKVGHNVLYCTYTGTPALSATIAENVRLAVVNGVTWTTFLALLHPSCSFAGVTILDVRSNTATAFDSTGAAIPGTSAGTALPDEVAAVVTLRTALRGQAGRGRFYVPGFASNAMGVGGIIAAAAVTALQNWAQTNINAGIAGALGAIVLAHPARAAYTSPATGRQFPARAASTVPLTNVLVRDNHWDSQRRRGLK